MRKISNYCVIGGAGFIGSHVVDELVSQGHNVLVLDNLSSGSLKNINKKAVFKKFDITSNWYSLAELLRNAAIEYVFHLAAEPYIPDCYEKPEQFFDVNANGTLNVLLACREADVKKILYYSTSEVYGTQYEKISEVTPLNPQSTYAVSKLAGDRLAFTLFHEHDIPVVILRQFNCYGERESHAYVIPEIISQVYNTENHGALRLGNIKAKRDFVYVKDAARLATKLLLSGKAGEVYNLGTGTSLSIEEIADIIIATQDKKINISIDKKRLRPLDVEKLEADNSRISSIIPLEFTDFRIGIENTIKWYLENGHKWGFE